MKSDNYGQLNEVSNYIEERDIFGPIIPQNKSLLEQLKKTDHGCSRFRRL
jgi:hypothetical protein